MKKVLFAAAAAAAVSLAGVACNKSSEGGPGASGKHTSSTSGTTAATTTTTHDSTTGGTHSTTASTPATTASPATTRSDSGIHVPEALGGAKNTFRIDAPGALTNTTIKQGDKKTFTLHLDRGSEFKQGVKMTADSSSPGVKATFEKAMVAAGDPKEVNLSVEVAKDAPVGDATVKITGTPDSGAATHVDMKVKVEAAK